jgi:hypothetical protein
MHHKEEAACMSLFSLLLLWGDFVCSSKPAL